MIHCSGIQLSLIVRQGGRAILLFCTQIILVVGLVLNCSQPPYPSLERSWNGYMLPSFDIGPYSLVVTAYLQNRAESSLVIPDNTLVVKIESEYYPGKADSIGLIIDSIHVSEAGTNRTLLMHTQSDHDPIPKKSWPTYDRGPVAQFQSSLAADSIPSKLIISLRARAQEEKYGEFVVRHFVTDTLFSPEWPKSGSGVYTTSRPAPNPFCPTTTISYLLPESSHVTITIYNVLGQVVDTLVNEDQVAGLHECQWNSSSSQPSGVYFYKLEAGRFTQTKKMVLLK